MLFKRGIETNRKGIANKQARREPSYALCEARLLAPPNPIKKQNDQKHEKKTLVRPMKWESSTMEGNKQEGDKQARKMLNNIGLINEQ